MLAISPQALSRRIATDAFATFPKPALTGGEKHRRYIWDRAEVERWIAANPPRPRGPEPIDAARRELRGLPPLTDDEVKKMKKKKGGAR